MTSLTAQPRPDEKDHGKTTSKGSPRGDDVHIGRDASREPALAAPIISRNTTGVSASGASVSEKSQRSPHLGRGQKHPNSGTDALDEFGDEVKDKALLSANAMSMMWPLYLEHAPAEDRETIKAWNADLDAILIFAALFSAVLTTFIIESYQSLQSDPVLDALQAILFEVQAACNTSTTDSSSPVLQPFRVASCAVRVNIYWFSSLILSLATALITILAKQWINYLLAGLSQAIPANRARHRQFRMDGVHRWKLPAILSILPILLHVALLLFFAGLVDFVWDVNRIVALISAVFISLTAIIYVVANALAYVYPDCPFKTSATVFFALVMDRLIVTWGKIRAIAVGIARTLFRHWDRVVHTCSGLCGHRRQGSSVEDGDFEIHTLGAISVSEARKYNPLRISSLRSHDEMVIKEKESSLDARVLLWLLRNSDRMHETEELNYAVRQFPHLVLHRRLFVKQGAITSVEQFLQSWVSSVPSFQKLSEPHKEAAAQAFHILAVLHSETTLDSPENVEEDIVLPTSDMLTVQPFLMVPPTTSPAPSLLSPPTYPIIISLLKDYRRLPLSLLASVLRLSVCIPESPTYPAPWSEDFPADDVVRHLFHLTLKPKVHSPSHRRDADRSSRQDHEDHMYAIKTIIYLALHDVWYPKRHGFLLPVLYSSYAWLGHMTVLMRPEARVSRAARRQLCWAVCAFAPAFPSLRPGEAIVEPRVPEEISTVWPFASRLTALLSWDTDPTILSLTLVALETLIRPTKNGLGKDDDSRAVLRLLSTSPAMVTFVAKLEHRLAHSPAERSGPGSWVAGELDAPPEGMLTLEDIRIRAVIRIALYISFSGPGAGVKPSAALIWRLLAVFRHILASGQYSDQADFPRAFLGIPSSPPLNWIYSITGYIITLFLSWPDHTSGLRLVDDEELLSIDTSADGAARSLCLALQGIIDTAWLAPPTTPHDLPLEVMMAMASDVPIWRIGPPLLEPFTAILHDILERWIRSMKSSPMPPTRDDDGDRKTPAVAIQLIQRGALHRLLDVSYQVRNGTPLRLGVLEPLLRVICAVFRVNGTDVLEEGLNGLPTLRHRTDPDHPAHKLALALSQSDHYSADKPLFLLLKSASSEWNLTKLLQVPESSLLVDLIRIAGNVTMYSPEPPEYDGSPPGDILVSKYYPYTPSVHDLVSYLSRLVTSAVPMSLTVRRHVWGSLGSIVTLYALPLHTLLEDTDPGRFFRFDTLDAGHIATGLVRASMLWGFWIRFTEMQFGGPDLHQAPRHRLLQAQEREQVLNHLQLSYRRRVNDYQLQLVYKEVTELALVVISMLWAGEDAESAAVRSHLRREDLTPCLQPILSLDHLPDSTRTLAEDILARLPPPEEAPPPPADENDADSTKTLAEGPVNGNAVPETSPPETSPNESEPHAPAPHVERGDSPNSQRSRDPYMSELPFYERSPSPS